MTLGIFYIPFFRLLKKGGRELRLARSSPVAIADGPLQNMLAGQLSSDTRSDFDAKNDFPVARNQRTRTVVETTYARPSKQTPSIRYMYPSRETRQWMKVSFLNGPSPGPA